ncbi:MAG: hypothetical protein WC785_08770 [Tatlockia sp.]|jgi:hypothetical protein
MRHKLIAIFSLFTACTLYAEDTELLFYRPFEEESTTIKQTVPGECWQQSHRLKREDALRCVTKEKTYDPCFLDGAHRVALCKETPWQVETVVISLSTPLDTSVNQALDMAEAYPWAIELTTGEKCQAMDEGQVFDGLPIHYQCNNQTLLLGRVQRCNPKWHILQKNDSQVFTATVAKAWF